MPKKQITIADIVRILGECEVQDERGVWVPITEDYKKDKLLQTKIPQQTDTLEEASFKLTAAGISPTSPKGLKFLIGIKDDTGMADNVVSVSGIKIEELTDPGKTNKIIKKLKPGYNILDDDGVKRIILYDGSGTAAGIDVMTVSEFWKS